MALVENLMTDNEDLILQTVHDRNIKEVIWTGHSLAGGKMHSLCIQYHCMKRCASTSVPVPVLEPFGGRAAHIFLFSSCFFSRFVCLQTVTTYGESCIQELRPLVICGALDQSIQSITMWFIQNGRH